MLRRIDIGNYKSITSLPIELGRFNVFIGENGAGKSNILEAIALASAAAAGKLDNEFLAARGVRVTRSELMRAGFSADSHADPITISVTHENGEHVELRLQNDNQPYSKWQIGVTRTGGQFDLEHFEPALKEFAATEAEAAANKLAFYQRLLATVEKWQARAEQVAAADELISLRTSANEGATFHGTPTDAFESKLLELIQLTSLQNSLLTSTFRDFLVYSPENSALRTFAREGQIEPLGINGEGLLKLIHVHASMAGSTALDEIRDALKMLGWFEDFKPSTEITDERLIIRDKYLEDLPFDLDQKSANEGFLFLLFYFALFTSKLTPQFFAIDNIDASLNPKLCQKLTTELVRLSKANDKQVIVTTHNPAVLDGLNLDDDEQRLFVVSRGRDGATKLKRIHKPASDSPSYRMSELFLRGLLGGLPKGF